MQIYQFFFYVVITAFFSNSRAVLLAKQQFEANLDMEYHSTILDAEGIDKLEVTTSHVRCQNCENH